MLCSFRFCAWLVANLYPVVVRFVRAVVVVSFVEHNCVYVLLYQGAVWGNWTITVPSILFQFCDRMWYSLVEEWGGGAVWRFLGDQRFCFGWKRISNDLCGYGFGWMSFAVWWTCPTPLLGVTSYSLCRFCTLVEIEFAVNFELGYDTIWFFCFFDSSNTTCC